MISVLLCTFNGSRWLPRQLQSLLDQDLKPSELVVCDDGSTDNTIALLCGFRDVSSFPVRIYRNKQRLGYALNYLLGVSLTEHPLVAFCDQDDVWLPDKLSLSYAVLQATNSLLVAHGFDTIDCDGIKLGSTFDATGPLPPHGYRLGPVGCAGFSLLLDKRLLSYAPSALSPENYLQICQPGHAPVGHDALLCDLASCLNAGAFIAKPLALHRLHDRNASKVHPKQKKADYEISFLSKAWLRWKERKSGYDLYSSLASRLTMEVQIYTLMSNELAASGYSVDYLANKLTLLKLRERDNVLRAGLYAKQTSGLTGFMQMMFQGCYQSDGVRLGRLNAIKDFIVVIAFVLRRW